MKRLCLGIGIFLLTFVAQTAPAVASINDFTISDFQADYYLDIDEEGRSILKTIETITAVFPEYDQNHGIERAIPKSYDRHSTSLVITSVTDENNNNLTYSTSIQNDNLVLRIGNANEYVHGEKTYVVTYTQRDVTKYFSDTDDDEFYWDVNGTGWLQTFDNVTARLHLNSTLVLAQNGDNACYFGLEGSTDVCEISQDDGLVTASISNLNANENMTIAVGFNSNTFVGYQKTFQDYAPYIAAALSLILLAAAVLVGLIYSKNAKGRGIIVPEYLPPKDISVPMAAELIGKRNKSIAAHILDLAVRHKIRVTETQTKIVIFKMTKYSFELIDRSGLSRADDDFLNILFPSGEIGSTYEFNNTDSTRASLLQEFRKNIRSMAFDLGYRLKAVGPSLAVLLLIILAILVPLIFFVISVGEGGYAVIFMIVWLLIFCSGILAVRKQKTGVGLIIINPLTEKGRDVYDYLMGLKMYIGLAEAERLKVLQSPKGAVKEPVNTGDTGYVVKLYERVLPYAVLFGQEKEWVKKLGEYYDNTQTRPDWYVGYSTFNAAVFTSSIGNFSSSINSYSSPSSSSSGGSSGGGGSGGGGGGGGGGGW